MRADQPAATHDSVGEIGLDREYAGQAGIGQIGAGEIGSACPIRVALAEFTRTIAGDLTAFAHVGLEQIGPRKQRAAEIASAQIGSYQAGVFKVGPAEVAAEDGRGIQAAAAEIGTDEGGPGEVGMRQVLSVEVEAGQIAIDQDRAPAAGMGFTEPAVAANDFGEVVRAGFGQSGQGGLLLTARGSGRAGFGPIGVRFSVHSVYSLTIDEDGRTRCDRFGRGGR
jgi:hypothetical protein